MAVGRQGDPDVSTHAAAVPRHAPLAPGSRRPAAGRRRRALRAARGAHLG